MKQERDFRIVEDIEHLTVNGLDDAEAKILRDAICKIEKKQLAEFEKSMKSAHDEVASWPKWKQDMAKSILR